MKTFWKHSLVILSMLFAGVALTAVHAQEGAPGRERGEQREGDRRDGERREGDRRFNPEQAIERTMRLDDDNDGKISKEEIGEGRMQAIFDRADADSDGYLTKEELTAMFQRAPQRDGDRPGPRPGMGSGGPGFGMLLPPFMVERLELTEEQRRELRALQEETQKKLAAILTEEQREQLQEMARRGGDRPDAREGERRGPRDGARGDRGPRDGERRDRGPRDGDRGERGDRDGDL